jgi:diadenosine tetraphosphate (Ap4A) HIT family hydrolase
MEELFERYYPDMEAFPQGASRAGNRRLLDGEYLDLQRLIYRVTEAVREEVGAEMMYLSTFGSHQGGAHVHWHVVPLPPGVPYEEQQGAWASWSKGVLKMPREEMASLAERIGRRVNLIYPS